MSLNPFNELLSNVFRIINQNNYDDLVSSRQIAENCLINNRYNNALQNIFQSMKNNSHIYQECNLLPDLSHKSKVLDNKIEQICKSQRDCAFSEDQYDRPLADKNIQLVNHYTEVASLFDKDVQNLRNMLHNTLLTQSYVRPLNEDDKRRAFNSIENKISAHTIILKEELLNYLMYINVQHNKKRGRRNFPKEATAILEKYFKDHIDKPYPDERDKLYLAEKCNLTTTQITNWFGNKRIRCMKKKKLLIRGKRTSKEK
uniref:Homeobox domain-containing protein n=1 Tax=Parastrongyloides trichosuri TaxID=131310 RepID=A0A0N4Z519_PARTI